MELGQAIQHGNLSYGSVGARFEEALSRELEVPYVTLVTSGSVGLLVALRCLGVSAGDEVIVPARTFQATANAAVFLGARAIPVDVLEHSALMDPAALEPAITPRTRAIIPVHLNGRACEMEPLQKIADRHGIPIVEDAAQALFSRGRHGLCGTSGKIGVFSLGVTKFLTSAQGGVLVTRDAAIHTEIRRYLKHAVEFSPEELYPEFGFNFRLPDLLTTLAFRQFNERNELKNRYLEVHARYRDLLGSSSRLTLLPSDRGSGEIPIWTEVLARDRAAVVSRLESLGIESRPFIPSMNECAYLGANPSAKQFPRASLFSAAGLTLPCGPELGSDAFRRISQALEPLL